MTVLTERFGKISVIAKGVRRITSRRAGNVEVLNRVRLHIFQSKSYNLSEAESIETFQKIKENLTLTTYAFHIIELIDRLVPEEQKNPQVYNLTLQILGLLNKNPRQIFIRAFEVKLLYLLGFWSDEAVPNLTPEVREILGGLRVGSWTEISNLEIKEETAMELERIMRYYIEKILESSLKSVQVLKKLK